MRAPQQKIAETTGGVEWFDTDTYTVANTGHYDAAGLVEMGEEIR